MRERRALHRSGALALFPASSSRTSSRAAMKANPSRRATSTLKVFTAAYVVSVATAT